jgi:hypothetical protein
VVRVTVEGRGHEYAEILLRPRKPRRDQGENVRAEHPRIAASRCDRLGRCVDVAFEELVHGLFGLRDQYGLAVGIEVRTPGTTGHLMVFLDRDRDHPLPAREPEAVAHDHAPRRQVQARGERRRRGDALDHPRAKALFDQVAIFSPEPGMVEGSAPGDAGGKRPIQLGCGKSRDASRILCQGRVLRPDCRRGAFRKSLGVPPRIDKDQALPSLGDRV